jgi:acetoin:2,6-dichlorophenolindophenol oxidoreductase subunit alpha
MNIEKQFENFRQMLTIRNCEQKLLDLYDQGQLSGTVHTCIGQEACAVGVVGALDSSRDAVLSNHRGHGHFLVHSNWNITGLFAEILGKSTGPSGGIGGSQHLHAKNFYSTGIQGSLLGVASGLAYAEKLKGTGGVVCVFIGDGTLGQGIVYESFNLAAQFELPVLFVVENNQYAQTTKTQDQHAGQITERSTPFGIDTTTIDVIDVDGVRQAADKYVSEMRNDSHPKLLHLNTYRLAPHSKGDDFRDKVELEDRWSRDPLNVAQNALSNQYPDETNRIIADVEANIAQALDDALAAAPSGSVDEGQQ